MIVPSAPSPPVQLFVGVPPPLQLLIIRIDTHQDEMFQFIKDERNSFKRHTSDMVLSVRALGENVDCNNVKRSVDPLFCL
mmetsp:Transcript_3388/g.8777  ORF Transcript_3388/g.8777 Transcript_3388/m.8777 type:complete len:80 (+) Transcript_3388:1541-1780(+)